MESVKELQKKHYDKMAYLYREKIDTKAYKYYFNITSSVILKHLKSNLKNLKNCSGLDVGCGNGDLVAFLSEECRTITGIDISGSMIKIARKENKKENANFLVSTSDELPFENNKFDFCLTVHTFHHLGDLEIMDKTIKEMKRVTKKSGIILVIDVNKVNPISFLIQYLMIKEGVDTGKEKLVWPWYFINQFKNEKIKLIKYESFCFIPHFFPKIKKYDEFLGKIIFLNKFGKDYLITGRR